MRYKYSDAGLFAAEGGDGIDADGAARGDVGGSERDDDEQERDAAKGDGVVRADSKEKRRDEANQHESSGQTDGNAGQRELERLGENHGLNGAALSAHGHADTNLLRALTD